MQKRLGSCKYQYAAAAGVVFVICIIIIAVFMSQTKEKSEEENEETTTALVNMEMEVQNIETDKDNEKSDISMGVGSWTEEINNFYLPLAEYRYAETNGFFGSKYDYPDVNSYLFETEYTKKELYYWFGNFTDDENKELVIGVGVSAGEESYIEGYLIADIYSYDGTKPRKVFAEDRPVTIEETEKIVNEYEVDQFIRWRRLAEIEDLKYNQGERLDNQLIHNEEEAVEYLLEYAEKKISYEMTAKFKKMDEYGYSIELYVDVGAANEIVSYYSVSTDGKIFDSNTGELCE